jgi:hypothetical protein
MDQSSNSCIRIYDHVYNVKWQVMVRINPSVTLELKSGQTITIDLD